MRSFTSILPGTTVGRVRYEVAEISPSRIMIYVVAKDDRWFKRCNDEYMAALGLIGPNTFRRVEQRCVSTALSLNLGLNGKKVAFHNIVASTSTSCALLEERAGTFIRSDSFLLSLIHI